MSLSYKSEVYLQPAGNEVIVIQLTQRLREDPNDQAARAELDSLLEV